MAEIHIKLEPDHMPKTTADLVEYLRTMACVDYDTGLRRMPNYTDDEVFNAAADLIEKLTGSEPPKDNVTGKPTRAEEIILAARAIIAAEHKHLRSLETDPNPDDPTTTSRDEADLLLAHLVSEFTVADCDTALRLVRRRSTSPKDLDAALPPKDQTSLSDLIERSKMRLAAMSEEERQALRQALRQAQRESFVRGMSTPCEHGVLDFEQCPDCRATPKDKMTGLEVIGEIDAGGTLRWLNPPIRRGTKLYAAPGSTLKAEEIDCVCKRAICTYDADFGCGIDRSKERHDV